MNDSEHTLIKLRQDNADLRTALAKRHAELADLETRLTAIEQARLALGLDQSPNHQPE